MDLSDPVFLKYQSNANAFRSVCKCAIKFLPALSKLETRKIMNYSFCIAPASPSFHKKLYVFCN